MTNLKFPLPPALVQAYADTNGFTPASSTPPAETSAPAGVPPTVNDGQEGGTQLGEFDFSELKSAVIVGCVTDIANGCTYPFGTCSVGYFLCDQFGWSTWPKVGGLLRGLEYALTGDVK